MSRLDDLIAELCPNGVEFKILSAVCRISNGKDHKKLAEGDIPVYGSGGIIRYVDTFIYNKPSVLIPRKGSLENLFYLDTPFWTVDTIFYTVINETLISPKFMYYYLATQHLEDLNTGGGVPSLTKAILDKVAIPVPPLPVQQEIVRILDKFTALEAELEARKKQYEYYRDLLLTFSEEVECFALREVADFRNGKGHEQVIVLDGKYIVVNSKFISTNGEVKKHSESQLCPLFADDILMVMSDLPNGRALAKCFLVPKNDRYTLNQRIGAFHVKEQININTKFLYYFLNRNRQLLKYDNGVDQTNLKKDEILNILIPIPPLSEQERIVAILDRFDALVNDITQGLPAEIEAWRKQYEYYRDKLLTFKEKVS